MFKATVMAIRWTVDPVRPEPGVIASAVDVLQRGELLILPTETVYGLAADPEREGAVESICRAKSRPGDKAVAFLVEGYDRLGSHGVFPDPRARMLAERYWPGPLTLVMESPKGFLGFRVPDHPVALAVLRGVGGPVAASSANVSGEAPALTADEAERSVGSSVAGILDAGPVAGGIPSTVIRVAGGRVDILREGAISAAEIERTI